MNIILFVIVAVSGRTLHISIWREEGFYITFLSVGACVDSVSISSIFNSLINLNEFVMFGILIAIQQRGFLFS